MKVGADFLPLILVLSLFVGLLGLIWKLLNESATSKVINRDEELSPAFGRFVTLYSGSDRIEIELLAGQLRIADIAHFVVGDHINAIYTSLPILEMTIQVDETRYDEAEEVLNQFLMERKPDHS